MRMRSRVVGAAAAVVLSGALSLSVSPAQATPGAVNGKIAFVRYDAEADRGAVFTIDPDGTNETQVGPGVDVGCPAWSPEGSTLQVCDFVPGESARPATANPDGSGFAVLDAYPGLKLELACDAWSPDGSRLLCSSNHEDVEGGNQADDGLYTVRSSDGGDLERVTTAPVGFFDSPMGYSPDGSRILFNRVHHGTGILYAVDPDGGNLVRLSPPEPSVVSLDFFEQTSADWSPDGSQVAFAGFWKLSMGNGGQNAIFVVNADGTALHQITPSGIGALSAQWSPDGQLIAFTSKGPHSGVYIVRPDGTGLRPIDVPSNGATSYTPVWSPDGQKLLFQRLEPSGQVGLWRVNLDGSGLAKLTDLTILNSYDWGTAPPG